MHAVAFAGTTVLGLGVLTGCTAVASEPAPKPVPSVSVNGLPPGVQLPSEVPEDVPNDPEDRPFVAIKGCQPTDSGWAANGLVINDRDSELSYEITVFFTTEEGTVIGFGTTTVDIAGSQTSAWEVATDFTAPDPTLCVLRGVDAS